MNKRFAKVVLPLCILCLFYQWRPDIGDERFKTKNWQQNGGDSKCHCQPEKRWWHNNWQRSVVVLIERDKVRHEDVAEAEVKDAAAPDGEVVEERPVPNIERILYHQSTPSVHIVFVFLQFQFLQTYIYWTYWYQLLTNFVSVESSMRCTAITLSKQNHQSAFISSAIKFHLHSVCTAK